MRVLFLGPPGAGKGTQAQRVAGRLGIPHVSTGDMFRALDPDTDLGRRVNEIMQSGGYVSDEIVIEMLNERIAQPDAEHGFILDGFPRTLGQAHALDAELADRGLDAVVVLLVDRDELVGRLLDRGRADDTEETVRRRLEVYEEETSQLVDLYETRAIVRRVDGQGDIEKITDRILEALQS